MDPARPLARRRGRPRLARRSARGLAQPVTPRNDDAGARARRTRELRAPRLPLMPERRARARTLVRPAHRTIGCRPSRSSRPATAALPRRRVLDAGRRPRHQHPRGGGEAEGTPSFASTSPAIAASRRRTSSRTSAKPGHLFKVENLASDVRSLWDSGFFDDVEVDMTRDDRGLILRFLVRERPNIRASSSKATVDRERQAPGKRSRSSDTILQRARGPPQRAEDQDAYAEKGATSRRRRQHRCAPARQRGHRQVQDPGAPARHGSAHHVRR